MTNSTIINGRQAYEEDYARAMRDPEIRALYEHEARMQDLWLRLVDTRKVRGLTLRQMAKRLNISQAQARRIEEAGYDCCTLDMLRHYVEVLDAEV